ncbi:MAG: prepilin peptidase [Candidatus Campbellbacteria bacterium]
MEYLWLFFAFAFGACVGSFLNVVILRYNTGRGINGRSGCAVCGAQLRWFELIPIVSFFVQKGRCRTCHSSVSWQYPLVEILTGALFVALYALYAPEWMLLALYAVEWSLLVVIVVYDMRHKIIPDPFVFAFCALALLSIFLSPGWGFSVPSNFWSALSAGPLLAAPFALLWLVSGGRWMGFGDAKLALGMGWMLGIAQGLSALVLSFWVGAIVSIGIILYERYGAPHAALSRTHGRLTMKSEIPFAPFLIIGLALVFFFGFDTFSLFI